MQSQSVVFVEDDPSILHDGALVLERAGYFVNEFENADDALTFILEHGNEVSAVFSDMQMPGCIDGLVLAEIVGRRWPHIAIILTSGRVRPMQDLPDNAHFISKPWRLSQIIGLLNASSDRVNPQ